MTIWGRTHPYWAKRPNREIALTQWRAKRIWANDTGPKLFVTTRVRRTDNLVSINHRKTEKKIRKRYVIMGKLCKIDIKLYLIS